jgi:hypothetical protein
MGALQAFYPNRVLSLHLIGYHCHSLEHRPEQFQSLQPLSSQYLGWIASKMLTSCLHQRDFPVMAKLFLH